MFFSQIFSIHTGLAQTGFSQIFGQGPSNSSEIFHVESIALEIKK